MLRSLMLVAVLVIGPVLPAAAQQVSEEDARQIVVSITGAYIKAIQKGDAAGLAALYTEDGLIVRPAGPVSGMESIKRFYEEVVKVVTDLAVNIDQVKVLGSGVILANATSQNTIRASNGSTQPGPKTYVVANFVHDSGMWKIRMIASSSTGFTVPSEKKD